MDFILDNLKFHRIDNLRNLDLIKDDDFWSIEILPMLEMVAHHLKEIQACVRILTCGCPEVV